MNEYFSQYIVDKELYKIMGKEYKPDASPTDAKYKNFVIIDAYNYNNPLTYKLDDNTAVRWPPWVAFIYEKILREYLGVEKDRYIESWEDYIINANFTPDVSHLVEKYRNEFSELANKSSWIF
jgi:hypothetical protein